MAKIFTFYGREIFDPGVYSKILTVGDAAPTPSGENALMIIAEAINGPAFGEVVSVGSITSARQLLGDQGPAIEAYFQASNPSSLSAAQDIRIFNPRALVQATGIIETVAAGAEAFTIDSRIYGPSGNSVTVSLASTLATVHFPWSEDDFQQTIDNPVMDIIMASGFITITATTISVGLTGALVDFTFLDYPKLIDLINAIEASAVAITITRDANISDLTNTLGLFDHLVGENDIATLTTIKGDMRQFEDFLVSIPDLEVTREATATVMVDDFSLTLAGGTSGVDPDATQWGKVYDELKTQKFAVTCPIADGLATPYDETLTKAVMALDESHAIAMNQPDQRGKKRQSFISAHGGYGWSGQFVAKPADAAAIAVLGNLHNSEYSQFFGDGVNAINFNGIEYAQLPCYFAVKAASMFVGGLASRVLTGQSVTAIKASTVYIDADRKKLHKASVIFAIDDEGTKIRQFFSTWKQTDEPMKTVPSRQRCVLLSDNDVARKLESWMAGYQDSGLSPSNSAGRTYIRSILNSHKAPSVNWVKSYGDVTFSSSGIEFEYSIEDHIVPTIPEIGFGTVKSLNV